jgi:hypothetical protein
MSINQPPFRAPVASSQGETYTGLSSIAGAYDDSQSSAYGNRTVVEEPVVQAILVEVQEESNVGDGAPGAGSEGNGSGGALVEVREESNAGNDVTSTAVVDRTGDRGKGGEETTDERNVVGGESTDASDDDVAARLLRRSDEGWMPNDMARPPASSPDRPRTRVGKAGVPRMTPSPRSAMKARMDPRILAASDPPTFLDRQSPKKVRGTKSVASDTSSR